MNIAKTTFSPGKIAEIRANIHEMRSRAPEALARRMEGFHDSLALRIPMDVALRITELAFEENLTPNVFTHEQLRTLSCYAQRYLALEPLFLGSVSETNRPFLKLLLEYWKDPDNPRFDLTVTPRQIFPFTEAEDMLKIANGTLCREKDANDFDLLFETGLCWTLSSPNPEDKKPFAIYLKIDDDYVDDEGNYSRMQAMRRSIIRSISVPESLRGRGFGSRWYLDYIEPYIISCGFSHAVVEHHCYESGAEHFWERLGFEFVIHLFDTFDGEDLNIYRGYKALQPNAK